MADYTEVVFIVDADVSLLCNNQRIADALEEADDGDYCRLIDGCCVNVVNRIDFLGSIAAKLRQSISAVISRDTRHYTSDELLVNTADLPLLLDISPRRACPGSPS